MYNKIFTKILDSSIWLEPTTTRIVWLTLIAAMDEDGFVQFASVANLAHRAILSLEDTQKAVACLESPDENSSDPEFDGRRIERVAGGWVVLNAPKYRQLVTRAVIKEQTRKRVATHRAKIAGNAPVTQGNETVTPSDSDSGAIEKSIYSREFDEFWECYPKKKAKSDAWKAWQKIKNRPVVEFIINAVSKQSASNDWKKDGGQFIPLPASWLNGARWDDEVSMGTNGFKLHGGTPTGL